MTRKKWLIVLGVGIAVCMAMVAVVVVAAWCLFLGTGGVDRKLPVYTHDQTDSTHPGYRRSTITCGTSVYVNDYEEYALQLIDSEPTNAIGRAPFGNAKICTIPGQSPADYLAADVGSEMPAYAVFRNSQHPPFDWRAATFQKMEFTWPNGSGAFQSTTDPALIDDVIQAMKNGTPANPPPTASVGSRNLAGVHLYSDQLPGLKYCPEVYVNTAGPVYLAENIAIEFTNQTTAVHANWIVAGPLFAKWVQAH